MFGFQESKTKDHAKEPGKVSVEMTGLCEAVLLLLKMAPVDPILTFFTSQAGFSQLGEPLGVILFILSAVQRANTGGLSHLTSQGSGQRDGDSFLSGHWKTPCS